MSAEYVHESKDMHLLIEVMTTNGLGFCGKPFSENANIATNELALQAVLAKMDREVLLKGVCMLSYPLARFDVGKKLQPAMESWESFDATERSLVHQVCMLAEMCEQRKQNGTDTQPISPDNIDAYMWEMIGCPRKDATKADKLNCQLNSYNLTLVSS